jgi:hypothetical protein
MLSDRDLKLLTAFIDGEISRRQGKALLRLLHESPEARSILVDLQENARRLQHLPRRQLGGAFARQVLKALAVEDLPEGRKIEVGSGSALEG